MLCDLIVRPDRWAPRYIFLSGKGGVGKTTIAASTAVWLAERGFRTLLVSTDVQPSLSDILGQSISAQETPVKGVANLHAFSVEPAKSMDRHRRKMADTLRVIDPKSVILKQLATDAEMDCGAAQASVFELSYFLNHQGYHRIVFDTAPTGMHLEKIIGQVKYALAMSQQIEARRERQKESPNSDLSREIQALEELRALDDRAIAAVRSDQTAFIMTLTPEGMPLAEVERNVPILEEIYHIPVRGLVINRVVPPDERTGRSFWRQRWSMQRGYVQRTRELFATKEIGEVFLVPEVAGLDMLRNIGAQLYGIGVREAAHAAAG
jgi:arsenite-transporting ATPase